MFFHYASLFLTLAFVYRVFSNFYDDYLFVRAEQRTHVIMDENCRMHDMSVGYQQACEKAHRIVNSPLLKLALDKTLERTHLCGDRACLEVLVETLRGVDNYMLGLVVTFLLAPIITAYLYRRFFYTPRLPYVMPYAPLPLTHVSPSLMMGV